MPQESESIGILGGGISALAFAWFSGLDAVIFEKEDRLGGLCRSFDVDGVPCDIGPHIMFSKDPDTLEFMKSLTRTHKIRRSNRIFHRGSYVKYPLENQLAALPAEDRDWCLDTFLDNPYREYPAANMLSFFYTKFGEGMACESKPLSRPPSVRDRRLKVVFARATVLEEGASDCTSSRTTGRSGSSSHRSWTCRSIPPWRRNGAGPDLARLGAVHRGRCLDRSALARGPRALRRPRSANPRPADALLRLLGDGELRARLARAGLAEARRFDWDRAVDAREAILLDIHEGRVGYDVFKPSKVGLYDGEGIEFERAPADLPVADGQLVRAAGAVLPPVFLVHAGAKRHVLEASTLEATRLNDRKIADLDPLAIARIPSGSPIFGPLDVP